MKKYLLLHPAAVESGTDTIEKPKADAKVADKTPDKKEDEVEELSAEELKERQKELIASARGNSAKKKADKAPDKVDDKPAVKKESKPAAATPPAIKAEKKEPEPTPKASAPLTQKPSAPVNVPPPIGDHVAPPPPKQSDEPKASVKLDAADIRRYHVLKQMEEDGTAPKGTAEADLRFLEKASAYKEKWEAAHPGEDYDPDASEHAKFYEDNESKIKDDDAAYIAAADNMVVKRAEGKIRTETEKREQAAARKKSFDDAQPVIAKSSYDAVMDMVEAAVPDLAEMMGKGEARKLDAEVTKKMVEKDPVRVRILQEVSEPLGVLIVELDRLTKFGDVYEVTTDMAVTLERSGQEIFPHAMLLKFIDGLEREMAALPPEKTMRDGKRFVPDGVMMRELQRINKDSTMDAKSKNDAVKNIQAHYYSLNEADYRRGLIGQYADKARKRIAQVEEFIALRTPKAPVVTPETGSQEGGDEGLSDAAKAQREQPDRPERRKSPTSASASDMSNPSAVKPGGEESLHEKLRASARR